MAESRSFDYPDKGSRVLREWNQQRQVEKAVQQRNRGAMRSSAFASQGFAGASIDRLTASLQQWSGAVNADLDRALVILRSRARALAANSEFGRRFLTMVALNVIGPKGPTLQVRATKTGSTDLDKAANDAVELHYKRWSKGAEITGKMNLAHMYRVCLKAAARDGEALIRTVYDKSLPYGMGLQLLEADRIDETINRRLDNGNIVRMGVEVDTRLRPLAYYVRVSHPGETFSQIGSPLIERVPASQIHHIFLPERAEQVRGYTWFHAVLLRAARIHGYEEAALVAALVGASKMGVFVRDGDQSGPALANQLADAKDATTGVPQMNNEPGEMIDLTGLPGTHLETWNPDYPHQNFEPFLKQCMRGFGAGLDVATHNLSGDMTDVNYSSARIAELAERDMWTMLQEWFFTGFAEKIYKDWLASALIRGDITFEQSGGALPARLLGKFSDAARFQGRTWSWIDPLKEVGAKIEAINAKLTSRTRVIAEDGGEFEDVIDEVAQEKTYADSKNVSLEPVQPKAGGVIPDDQAAGDGAAPEKPAAGKPKK
jgi:lambda family phage portal protein